MPIYEYLCQACGHELEAIQKISDPLLTDCPACARSSLKKKLTAGAFRLSGSGWYETDFKTGDNKRNLAGDDGMSGSGASSGKPDGNASGNAKTTTDNGGSGAVSDSKTAATTK